MKNVILVIGLFGLSFAANASGMSCEDLKAKIEKKLDGKGVKAYDLQIVARDLLSKSRNVGSCEGGKKKILYERATAVK